MFTGTNLDRTPSNPGFIRVSGTDFLAQVGKVLKITKVEVISLVASCKSGCGSLELGKNNGLNRHAPILSMPPPLAGID